MLLDMIMILVAEFSNRAGSKNYLIIQKECHFFLNYSSGSVKMIWDAVKVITVPILVKTAFVRAVWTVVAIITGMCSRISS